MDFKGQYLSYEEYKALGGTLDQVPFNLLEYDVRKIIDERTFCRLKNIIDIPDEVKMCAFTMISIKDKYKVLKEQNMVIASVNNDGYSETYRKLEKADIELENEELVNTINTHLSNVIVNKVPLLYLGVDIC